MTPPTPPPTTPHLTRPMMTAEKARRTTTTTRKTSPMGKITPEAKRMRTTTSTVAIQVPVAGMWILMTSISDPLPRSPSTVYLATPSSCVHQVRRLEGQRQVLTGVSSQRHDTYREELVPRPLARQPRPTDMPVFRFRIRRGITTAIRRIIDREPSSSASNTFIKTVAAVTPIPKYGGDDDLEAFM